MYRTWDYSPGRGINNVYFKNVSYTGSNTTGNTINGYDATRRIQNITFENLKLTERSLRMPHKGILQLTAIRITLTSLLPEIRCLLRKRNFHPLLQSIWRSTTRSASSSQGADPASSGNDSNTSTRWSADDGNVGQWWTVDLGASRDITHGT